MLEAPGVARSVVVLLLFGFARHGRFRLCLLFLPEFLITRFSAIGDLRQELADVFDFGLGPEMNRHSATGRRLGGRYLPSRNIATERRLRCPEFFSRLPSRKRIHYVSMIQVG